jgi:hypothetical protein
MKLSDIILERYINLHTDTQMLKYIDVIWDILQSSYKPIGGFLTAKNKQELIEKTGLAKIVRRDGKIVAVALYKDNQGRKVIGGGTDGSEQGKKDLKKIMYDDMKLKRAWAEVSGAMEHILTKYEGVPIPNEYAEEILGKKILKKNPDGYHYTREIGGKEVEKMLIGTLHNK